MGEYAEMMLDGTLCEGCGVYLGSTLDCPCLCSDCARDRKADGHAVEKLGDVWVTSGPASAPSKPRFQRLPCRLCGRQFKSAQAVSDHQRDKHGEKP